MPGSERTRFVEIKVAESVGAIGPTDCDCSATLSGPLRCGDELTWAYRLNSPRIGTEYGETTRSEVAATSLSVIRIESYGQSVAEIHDGMTARISIEGDDVDKVEEGLALGNASSFEWVAA